MIVIEWQQRNGNQFAIALYDPETHKIFAWSNAANDYIEVKEPNK